MLTLNKLVKQRYSPRSSKSRQINNPKAPHTKKNGRVINGWDYPSKLNDEIIPARFGT